jgi:hypothetical protein
MYRAASGSQHRARPTRQRAAARADSPFACRYGGVRADGNLLLFTRELGRERILVALNFGGEATTASLASGESAGRLLLSSAGDREDEPIRGNVELRPHEGIVVEVRTPVE